MKLNKEYLEEVLVALIPILGLPVSLYLMSGIDINSSKYIRRLLIVLPISLITTIVFSLELLKNYIIEVLAGILVSSVGIMVYNILKSENISLYVDEYSIIITMHLNLESLNFSKTDLNNLIIDIVKKAMRKIKNPYYREKLSILSTCGSSPRVALQEDKLIIRKRCGDSTLEIVIENNSQANIKFEIQY
ncbi:MAG: hypothetical protein JZD40_01935 [Sulfolobus sp.]|nr:hypothetical protein [Sulfolobus sp.]